MKKIYLVIFLFLSVVSSYAQKVVEGTFSPLVDEKIINIKIDYSESEIDEMPFEAFLEVENRWEEGYNDIMIKFLKSLNKYSDGIVYSAKKETNYRLVFKAMYVNRDGETKGHLLLYDKDNKIIGATQDFYVKGGRFGSQTNLMGDAAERLGKKISQFIKKQTKK